MDGADPFSVLDIPKLAGDDEVRAAYLEATKTFHPNRFARRDGQIRDLSNEVFLLINKAYSKLSSDEARQKTHEQIRRGRRTQTTQSPIPVSAAGEVLKSPTRPADKRSFAPARPRRSTQRGTTDKVATTVAFKKPGGSTGRPAQATPTGGIGSDKASTRSKPLSVDEMRRQRRKERMASRRRDSTPPPEDTPSPPAPRDPEQVTREVMEREEKRKDEFRAAQSLVRQGQLSAAKEMFRQLAVDSPKERKYRVYMHYTWGRELQAAGRDEDALVEYNRALGLDPGFEPALKSVATLRLGDGKKQGGLLSRFFGKE
jgi:curved DNA-binding protein CbpA